MDTSQPRLKLIFALGNNDPAYKNTYHNVGFLMADYLEENFSGPAKILKNPGYMNEAGNYLKKPLKQNNAKPEELLVIHDDSDLKIGQFKLALGKGAAGHHGVESVMANLKTQNFWRLRIGIRPINESAREKAEKFVLKKITAADQKILRKTFEDALNKIKTAD